MSAAAMAVALATGGALGWPDQLRRAIGHPVTWLGRLITHLDRRLNLDEDEPATRRFWGRVALGIILLTAVLPTLFITAILPDGWVGVLLTGLIAAPLVAPRSTYTQVADVAAHLAAQDLPAARGAVARIISLNPETRDTDAIARATIESLARNTSDCVVAPIFWGVLFGLPGIAAYKAIDTADSLIADKSDRHINFGRATASLDDIVNWVPARLTALFIAAVQPNPLRALKVTFQHAGSHRSPNAGWPQAAMAGALNIRLSGPHNDPEGPHGDPFVNSGAPDPSAVDIERALTLYLRAIGLLAVALCILAIT